MDNQKTVLSNRDYNEYFEKSNYKETELILLPLGKLAVPTGEIIACDPLAHFYHSTPFNKSIQPGQHPVIACIGRTEDLGYRYAVVKLEILKTKAVKWELAIVDGQDVNELNEDDFFGFPVDAGLGCFMDLKTKELFNIFNDDFFIKNPDENIYDDFFAAEFKKNAMDQNDPGDAGDWLNFYLPNQPDLNVIIFQSGYGDGVYPCYWGIDENGEICSLIADFNVL